MTAIAALPVNCTLPWIPCCAHPSEPSSKSNMKSLICPDIIVGIPQGGPSPARNAALKTSAHLLARTCASPRDLHFTNLIGEIDRMRKMQPATPVTFVLPEWNARFR